MVPVTTTAPATIHRLIRPISANPASLALTELLLTMPMIGRRAKKRLSRG
jgi:hypothetical protein